MSALSIEPLVIQSKTPPIPSQHNQNKRKRDLHDYFSSPVVLSSKTSNSTTTDTILNPISITTKSITKTTKPPTLPPGLTIIPNFITPSEETTLLTFLATQPWRTDLSRRVLHYGGTYCLLPPRTASPQTRQKIQNTIITAPPLPPEFSFILSLMISHDLYSPSTIPTYCIVNEYTGLQGISAHVENFRFGEPVCALTLGDGDFMRFHELERRDDGSVRSGKAQVAPRTGKRIDVWMSGRSLLVMRGESRGLWQHEIVRGRKRRKDGHGGGEWKRTSLTFRTDKK